jgi:RNA polymerase sigma factor FliA
MPSWSSRSRSGWSSLYYFEELKLHEIAAILELTESRISQIRSKAISRLRARMAPLREQVA